MKKAWEEQWVAEKPATQNILTTDGEWVARFSPSPGISPDHELARTKLAASAPAMARLLRALYGEHGDRVTFDWAYWAEEIEAALLRAGVPLPEDGEPLPKESDER